MRQDKASGDKKKRPPTSTSVWGRVPLWAYVIVVGAALGLAIGLPVYLSQGSKSSPTNNTVPSNVTAVSRPAPGFSLKDPYGQTYTLKPGDGKAHLLVFYMGYF